MRIPDIDRSLERGKGERCVFSGTVLFVEMFEGNGICITRNGTQNVTYTNRKTLLNNDMLIYTRYVNTDMKTDQLLYTDETWVNTHHTKDYIWVDSDGKGGWKVPSGKGQRLIVAHAGGVEGWVEGADLVFKSKTNLADYHDEMNNQHVMEWLTQQLLPNVPPNSVIVLDNATYHSKLKDKPPTTANKRDEIKDWLRLHGIHFEDHEIKRTLLEKVRQNRPEPLYLTDEAARDKGHTVLRLPVAHCELNPIELAWASSQGIRSTT